MRNAKSSSRWHGIFKSLGFGNRGARRKPELKPHLLRLEPLEQRALLSATVQFDHIVAASPLASASPPNGAFTPAQIRSAYGIDSINLGSLVGDGSGQTIAIVDAYDHPGLVSSTDANFLSSDLHQFDAQFGLSDPPSFQKVDQTGGTSYPSADYEWAAEEDLDVEWAHAIAPGANILLVEANSSSWSDLMTAVERAGQTPGVVAVSMSWGTGEFSGETAYDSDFNVPGVTFLAATGDRGAPSSYPAYSPYVVAAGGTTLTAPGGVYSSESGWSGSGGGPSSFEAAPFYQQGVQQSAHRQNPDVAFDANPNTGVAVYDSYNLGQPAGWLQIGGTSLSSPCWAGVVAIADQLRGSEELPPLDSLQTLSRLYQLSASDLHDITTGSNGYSAGAGYDMVTGLGSPVAGALVPDILNATGPDLCVTVADSGNFTQCDIGDTYTISVSNIGDSPTTSAVNLTDALPAGLTATAFTSSDSGWNINPATLTATRDSLGADATTQLTLTVNVASNAQASVTETATVSGGGETRTDNDVGTDATAVFPGGPVCTWTGEGADNNWTTAANWDVAPTAGSRLVFSGTERQSPVNDFPAGTAFGSITFTSSGFTLSGNSLILVASSGAAINDVGCEDTIALPITLGASSTFDVAGSGALNLTPTATIDMNGNDFFADCEPGSTGSQWAAPITGAGDFVLVGGGTLTLTGASTYLGNTYIEDGTLVLAGRNSDNRLPTTTTVTLGTDASYGTLQLGNTIYGRNEQTVAGLYAVGYDNGLYNSVVGGCYAALPTDDSVLTVSPTSVPYDDYDGRMGGSGTYQNNLALAVGGGSFWLWDSDNSYAGGTTLTSGSDLGALGSGLIGSGPLNLEGGDFYGSGTFNNNIVAQENTASVISSMYNVTVNGTISGAGEIDYSTGSGNQFTLTGDDSGFTGIFWQNYGTTYLTSPSAGSASATWWIDGGTFAANVSNNPTNQPIELGALVGGGGTLTNVGSAVTFEIGGNNTNPSTEFDGIIKDGSGSATVALTKIGAGRLTLAGANTYSGVTTIASGALEIANASAVNTLLTNAGGVNNTGGFLMLDYTAGNDPASTVLSLLTTAYNAGVNSFQSGQIRDSGATISIGLGWVDNAATFQITIMPALYGDANLNGATNFTDLSKLLANYGKAGTYNWSQGDFNYDGTVNFSDMSLLLATYGTSGPLNINNAP
jgi:uncharacterized repeat protein (TIGR01451 family)